MSTVKWHVTFKVYRQKRGQVGHFQEFKLEVDPDEYVLDGVERIWAFHDRTVMFRHACHHSACGACGMRVNGVEKLTCITLIRDITQDGGTVTVEPLRNFPVMGDLVVDMGSFYTKMEDAGATQVVAVADTPLKDGIRPSHAHADEGFIRLGDCIECGLCVSACPVAATDPAYLGPAALAAIQLNSLHQPGVLDLADQGEGLWRCHSAFECSEVCPSFVEPGWRIMDLRKQAIIDRVKVLFGRKQQEVVK